MKSQEIKRKEAEERFVNMNNPQTSRNNRIYLPKIKNGGWHLHG